MKKGLMYVGMTCLLCALPLQAQQEASDRIEFQNTRAKAENGEANAQFILGYYYAAGLGTPTDKVQAVAWYRKAAEQGLAGAQYNLGCCYDNGEGVAKDAVEAAKWYRKAAEQGLAEAQYNFGSCCKRGEGVKQNYEEAAKWYRKAAEQGYGNAQFNLGVCYVKGEGATKDDVEGYMWIRLSSEHGHAQGASAAAKLENALTPEQIAEGKRRVNAWNQAHKQQTKPKTEPDGAGNGSHDNSPGQTKRSPGER